jgi:hypothetical protein
MWSSSLHCALELLRRVYGTTILHTAHTAYIYTMYEALIYVVGTVADALASANTTVVSWKSKQ